MINCAHPSHFSDKLVGGSWTERIMAVRANASCKSHEELDESEHLDVGDKFDLAQRYKKLKEVSYQTSRLWEAAVVLIIRTLRRFVIKCSNLEDKLERLSLQRNKSRMPIWSLERYFGNFL